MLPRIVPFFVLTASCAFAAAPEGVPRDLARDRAAAVSDLHYHLSFVLAPHATSTVGHEEIRFNLAVARMVLLDYRNGELTAMKVNEAPVTLKLRNGHLELPADKLRSGQNTVVVDFTSQVAPAGKPITRYHDRDDNSEYIYTLFVPMDASMAFPCFDQPDLKGRFRLEITAPQDWIVISNTPVENTSAAAPGQRRTVFGETPPISTYLLAFAAGPFRKLHEVPGLPGLYVPKSKMERAGPEAPELQQITAQGIQYLSSFFAQPFPFPKYDTVLIPGFPYGGMEHAGATFLREESVLFRTAPTHTDLLNRDILLLHELTHQWFGDFTTMRWFDDLWLKEGFAQYMAYQTLAALKPNENVWKRLYEESKPEAYEIDSTQGTTPIYQDVPNLKDAKSAYGAIVYSKAPGVLKQLAFILGPEHFRDALRLYLKEHAYSNAEWSDLVHAFERISGRSLTSWAEMWIRHRGMPQVDVGWACDNNRLTHFSLSQHDVLAEGGIWPIATQVVLSLRSGKSLDLRVNLNSASTEVHELIGKPCPDYVFANDHDYAYGRFLLDLRGRQVVMQQLGGMPDLFRRTLLWGSLWESVREAELAPREFLSVAEQVLPAEADESLTQTILSNATVALHRYVSDSTRTHLVPAIEKTALDRMLHSGDQGQRIIWFRSLCRIAETPEGRSSLKALLAGDLSVPGVGLRPLDRWHIVTALIALNDPEADSILRGERERDNTGDGQKYAYIAEAARPDSQNKSKYFEDYLHNGSRQEDWIVESLGAFNYWNQSELTDPFLRPALEALPQIKRDRKIFFLLAWLRAFIDGQQSRSAQSQVHQFLQSANLDKDLQLKVLQSVDELDRTVKIRQRFADSGH